MPLQLLLAYIKQPKALLANGASTWFTLSKYVLNRMVDDSKEI
jgi:hypothetical protein